MVLFDVFSIIRRDGTVRCFCFPQRWTPAGPAATTGPAATATSMTTSMSMATATVKATITGM